jgi:hypothetical protein
MQALRSRLSLCGLGSPEVDVSGPRYIEVSSRAFRFVRDSNLPRKGLHVRMLSIVIRLRVGFGDSVDIDPELLAGEVFSAGRSRGSSLDFGRFSSVSIRSRRSRIAKLAGSKLYTYNQHKEQTVG